METILITTSSFGAQDAEPKTLLRTSGLAVQENPFRRTLTESELSTLLHTHRPVGLIAGVEPLTAAVLEAAASHLKVISRCGAGLDSVDLQKAAALGIAVYNTPEAPSQAVAELALGCLLNLIRELPQADRRLRAGTWSKPMGFLLGELVVGVVGLGRIGKRVATLVRAFGADVIATDPVWDLAWAGEHQVARATLQELLHRVDVVTLHVSPVPSAPLIGAAELAQMKRGAYLINVSRGGLVDERALHEALRSGHLKGAALDTFEREPYDGPLRELENVLLTPHLGSYARAARNGMEREAAENLIRGLAERGVLHRAAEPVR